MEQVEVKKCVHLEDWTCHAPNQERETCIACVISGLLQDTSSLLDACLDKKIKIREAAPYYEKLLTLRLQSLALSSLLGKNIHMKPNSELIINLVPVDTLIKKFGGDPSYIK